MGTFFVRPTKGGKEIIVSKRLEIKRVKRPFWEPLKRTGTVNVSSRQVLEQKQFSISMLHFQPNGTIDEHDAPINIDVICLQGNGFTSIGQERSPIYEGERVRWPANVPHRLWTTDNEMVTVMVEHAPAPQAKWEDVDSSMIAAFKYNPTTQTLDVMFNRNGLYRYDNVPADVVQGLRDANSKGSYMRWAIIDRYG